MRYTSIFSLREVGGVSNFPAKIKVDPQFGFKAIPFFGKHIQAMKKCREKGSNWGIGGPSIVKDNPQGGIKFFSIFGPNPRMYNEKGGTKPAKPKGTKPMRPRKGKPAHKKLHPQTHPILAEAFAQCMGKFLKHSKEADSVSMYPAVTTPSKKVKESAIRITATRLKEAAAPAKDGLPTKFRVVLIEEGLGNRNDAYYYTREALESGVKVFNGLKIYVDHPTAEEEDVRPERTTRDAIGHYENLAVEVGFGGQAQLCADLDVLQVPDTKLQRAQLVRAIENAKKFPDIPFVGLSINAAGPSQESPIDEVISTAPQGAKQKLLDAQGEGIETVKVVSQINRAVSCDLVTEAGAGGKVLNIIGGDADGQEKA